MIIPYQNTFYECHKSILIAGPTASGKSHLITRLEELVQAPTVHREVVEEEEAAPADSLIHWPIAEKFPPKVDLSSVGVVLLLGQHWESYCLNVDARKHATQYSKSGLASLFRAWHIFFSGHKLPMMDVPRDVNLIALVPKMLVVMKLVISY